MRSALGALDLQRLDVIYPGAFVGYLRPVAVGGVRIMSRHAIQHVVVEPGAEVEHVTRWEPSRAPRATLTTEQR